MFVILLFQQSPFAGEDEEDLFDSICRDKVHYPKWISSAAEDCLSQVGTIHVWYMKSQADKGLEHLEYIVLTNYTFLRSDTRYSDSIAHSP